MWLLLVAAGSGYLARCWHKTLKPKHQLTDFAHVEPEDLRNEIVASISTPQMQSVLGDSSSDALRRSLPDVLGNELSPKSQKRNLSPRALSKKLFSSDLIKSGKASKKEAAARSSADENSNLLASGVEKFLAGTGGQSKKSAWSTFKSKRSPSSKEIASEDNSRVSAGCLKRTGDSFRKSRERRRSDNGSSSSRSLQAYFCEEENGPTSVRSSEREVDPVDSISTGLPDNSLSGVPAVDVTPAEPGEVPGFGKLPEVAASQLRPKVVENEAKPPLSSTSESPSTMDSQGSDNVVRVNVSSARRDVPSSVAEVVARIEKGNAAINAETVNAVHSFRTAANPAALGDIENSVEEAEVFTGGKGKRRADVGKVAVDDDGKALPAALLSGKRTKDSKDANKPLGGESGGITLTSVTCKRMKDVSKSSEDAREADEPSPSSIIGTVDISQVFFGFDNAFLGFPREEKSPYKHYKRSRYMNRPGYGGTIRKMRESPRPVSALESCLRAQFPYKDEGSRVARSLNFSSLVSQSGQRRQSLEPGAEMPFSKGLCSPSSSVDGGGLAGSEQQGPQCEGAIGLPSLKSSPTKGSGQRSGSQFYERGQHSVDSASNYPRKVVLEDRRRVVPSQAKIADVLWRPTTLPVALKKRKISQACSPSATSTNIKAQGYELEALVIPPMEGLLFSFGVGIGVMSLLNEPDDEIERLRSKLHNSEEEIENLNKLLRQAKDSVAQAGGPLLKQVTATGVLTTEVVTGELMGKNEPLLNRLGRKSLADDAAGREMFDLYRKEAPETPQQIEHMAELEAELEAELDALTSGMTEGSSDAPDFEELDPEGVAGVADRDIGVEGLPAVLDWDDDNDDFITEEVAHMGGGVPPRELSRLLRKVQSSWQGHLIAELEADLLEKVEKLQIMERELQQLREETRNGAPPSAGFKAERLESVAVDVSEDLDHIENRSLSAYIEQLNRNVFEDQKYLSREEDYPVSNRSGEVADTIGAEKSSDEPSPSMPVRHELRPSPQESVVSGPGSSLLGSAGSENEGSLWGSLASEPASCLRRSVSSELGSFLQGSAPSEAGSSAHESVTSLILSEKTMDCEAQADNDAVCDEFLNSVFGSPEDGQGGGDSMVTSPLMSALMMPLSLDHNICTTEDYKHTVIGEDLKDVPQLAGAKSAGEDLDEVVGELLKCKTSSVKNALNALLLWEAETDDVPSKDDLGEEGTGPYCRQTVGNNPTTGQQSSTSVRPEQQARSTSFSVENMPFVDKTIEIPKWQDLSNSADKRATVADKRATVADNELDVFQPSVPKLGNRSIKLAGPREQPLTKKDQSSQASKPPSETLRDLFRSESPSFGSLDKDFQALLNTRRELRYSSSRVQLSMSGPPLEVDAAPVVYRQSSDASRAGTNSPTGRHSSTKVYQSPKLKNSRLSFENRLYQNPTSDWLSEVGSPPDKH